MQDPKKETEKAIYSLVWDQSCLGVLWDVHVPSIKTKIGV